MKNWSLIFVCREVEYREAVSDVLSEAEKGSQSASHRLCLIYTVGDLVGSS